MSFSKEFQIRRVSTSAPKQSNNGLGGGAPSSDLISNQNPKTTLSHDKNNHSHRIHQQSPQSITSLSCSKTTRGTGPSARTTATQSRPQTLGETNIYPDPRQDLKKKVPLNITLTSSPQTNPAVSYNQYNRSSTDDMTSMSRAGILESISFEIRSPDSSSSIGGGINAGSSKNSTLRLKNSDLRSHSFNIFPENTTKGKQRNSSTGTFEQNIITGGLLLNARNDTHNLSHSNSFTGVDSTHNCSPNHKTETNASIDHNSKIHNNTSIKLNKQSQERSRASSNVVKISDSSDSDGMKRIESKEGIICPICLAEFMSVNGLTTHYMQVHKEASESMQSSNSNGTDGVMGWLVKSISANEETALQSDPSSRGSTNMEQKSENLINRAHWVEDAVACQQRNCDVRFSVIERQHHCRRCGKIFCNSHIQYKMRLDYDALPNEDGIVCKVCETCYRTGKVVTNELGIKRNLARKFKTLRKTRVNQLDLDTNKLLGRLDKLLRYTSDDGSQNKLFSSMTALMDGNYEVEKSIVDWEDGKSIATCPDCGSKFGYILCRQHHCRLCGKVKCNNCCNEMLEYGYLASIRQAMGLKHCPTPTLSGFKLRACKNCTYLIDRRKLQTQRDMDVQQSSLFPLLKVYDRVVELKSQCNILLLDAIELSNIKYPKKQHLLYGQTVRKGIKNYMEALIAIGKSIAALPLPDGTVADIRQTNYKYPSTQRLQYNFARSLGLFVRECASTVSYIPTQIRTRPSRLGFSSKARDYNITDANCNPGYSAGPTAEKVQSRNIIVAPLVDEDSVGVFIEQRKMLIECMKRAQENGNTDECNSLQTSITEIEKELEKSGFV